MPHETSSQPETTMSQAAAYRELAEATTTREHGRFYHAGFQPEAPVDVMRSNRQLDRGWSVATVGEHNGTQLVNVYKNTPEGRLEKTIVAEELAASQPQFVPESTVYKVADGRFERYTVNRQHGEDGVVQLSQPRAGHDRRTSVHNEYAVNVRNNDEAANILAISYLTEGQTVRYFNRDGTEHTYIYGGALARTKGLQALVSERTTDEANAKSWFVKPAELLYMQTTAGQAEYRGRAQRRDVAVTESIPAAASFEAASAAPTSALSTETAAIPAVALRLNTVVEYTDGAGITHPDWIVTELPDASNRQQATLMRFADGQRQYVQVGAARVRPEHPPV